VARLISARGSLGTKRQVFFCRWAGSTHDSQLGAHATLMTNLGNALAAFDRATEALRGSPKSPPSRPPTLAARW
jgi:uncharacterized protein (DUF1501 family)